MPPYVFGGTLNLAWSIRPYRTFSVVCVDASGSVYSDVKNASHVTV